MRQSILFLLACLLLSSTSASTHVAAVNRRTKGTGVDAVSPVPPVVDTAVPVVPATVPPTTTPVLPPTHRSTHHPVAPLTDAPSAPPSLNPVVVPTKTWYDLPTWAYAAIGAGVVVILIFLFRMVCKKDEGYQQVPEISLNV